MRIAILFGGKSGEHEVSLVSASSIISYLPKQHIAVPIGITKKGEWIKGTGDDVMDFLKTGDNDISNLITCPLSDIPKLCDFVFPVLHGPNGEDGTVQGLLEVINIPYAGCGVLASSSGMDKIVMKHLFTQAGLRLTPWFGFSRKEWQEDPEKILDRCEKNFQFPMFSKPSNMGSSVGVEKANSRKELEKNINLAATFDRRILVEQGVIQPREIELSVLGNDTNIEVSIPGEIVPDKEFYSFQSKYISGGSETLIPAPNLSEKQVRELQSQARKAFQILDGSGFTRVDFLLSKEGEIYINEVNTIPGFTSISMYPKLWEHSGILYSQLLERIIQLGIERWDEKQSLNQSFDSESDWFKD